LFKLESSEDLEAAYEMVWYKVEHNIMEKIQTFKSNTISQIVAEIGCEVFKISTL